MRTRSIIVHPAAAGLRRELGAQAWAALEVLIASIETPDADIVVTSARALAVELGVSKNTAARALAVLSSAGFIAPRQRRSAAGNYEAGTYQMFIPASIALVEVVDPPAREVAHAGPRVARGDRRVREATQLSLLDAG